MAESNRRAVGLSGEGVVVALAAPSQVLPVACLPSAVSQGPFFISFNFNK